jgi:hypothetical protein
MAASPAVVASGVVNGLRFAAPQWTTPRPPGGAYKPTAPHEVRLTSTYSVLAFGAAFTVGGRLTPLVEAVFRE